MRAIIYCAMLLATGCGNGSVMSMADAQKAYTGIDLSIDKAIGLGFDGFNAATSANIAPQTAAGALSGTLTVTGQVDQGASANKGMRLAANYAGYSDAVLATDPKVVYDSPGALPALDMMLKSIPTGTLSGTFIGALTMSGELKNVVTLNLAFTGDLMAGAGNTVVRKPGTTHITGTAASDYGTFTVDVTR